MAMVRSLSARPAPVCCHLYRGVRLIIAIFLVFHISSSTAVAKAQAANSAPDVLVLSNGDTLHGKLLNSSGGKITFHSDPLGDISLDLDKIKELHAGGSYAVITKGFRIHRKNASRLPQGTIEISNKAITIGPENAPAAPPIPTSNTAYILDKATLDKQVYHEPGFTHGWTGAATAGASIVNATQNQYSFSGGIGLVRLVPSVSWLDKRNRTTVDFTGSYGKITEPAFINPGPPPVAVPSNEIKTAIYHADAERDEYFTSRVYALGLVAFDHNFSQNLDLQQIYGGGVGWTAVLTPRQELDLKGTVQYTRQAFISGSPSSRNLIGSTFSADYVLREKLFTFTQQVAYIPAWNDLHAYSVSEVNTLAIPTYKHLGFSLGTLNTYLNGPPATLPPTKRNSFQFTMGLTYAIKSEY